LIQPKSEFFKIVFYDFEAPEEKKRSRWGGGLSAHSAVSSTYMAKHAFKKN